MLTLTAAALALTPCVRAQSTHTWTYGSAAAASGHRTTQVAVTPADASAGTIGFVFTNGGFTTLNGEVSIDVSRTGGSAGPVSVTCVTDDGSAVAGVDYAPTGTTLFWDDGDTTSRTFTVPIYNRNLHPAPRSISPST